jgi:hypothetical protein
MTGALAGHTICVGQSVCSNRQLPSGQRKGAVWGHSQLATAEQSDAVDWQLLSGHNTGEDAGQVTVVGQLEAVLTQVSSGHCTEKLPLGHEGGEAQLADDSTHELSGHSTGAVEGQVTVDGQKREFCTHCPDGQRIALRGQDVELAHWSTDTAQVLPPEQSTHPAGQTTEEGQSASDERHDRPSGHISEPVHVFGDGHAFGLDAQLPSVHSAPVGHVEEVGQSSSE